MGRDNKIFWNGFLLIVRSKRDIYGNCYGYFEYTDARSGLQVLGNVGNASDNARMITRYWDGRRRVETWTSKIDVTESEIPIREFNRRIKGMAHCGSDPEEMVNFIICELKAKKALAKAAARKAAKEVRA